MERRSRSANRRSVDANRLSGREGLEISGKLTNGVAYPPPSSLHNRPGGDSRTLSPDRRNSSTSFPKTSPHHNKSGSYNHYTQPPLTLPGIALGVNGKTNPPAPLPPRAPVQSSSSLLTEPNNNVKTVNNKLLQVVGGSITTPPTSSSSASGSPPASLQHVSSPQQQVRDSY